MKICTLLLVCFFSLFLPAGLIAQNLFTEKVDMVNNIKFCMDCGAPKANCDDFTLDYISFKINHRYNFKDGNGTIKFQVLVYSNGFSSVLSHTDVTHSALTDDLIRYLNGVLWTPAIEHGKRTSSSVNVVFSLYGGRISGRMERMDLTELAPPGNPTVYNNQYHYSNPSLNNYDFTIWTRYNSPLPGNIGQACLIDKSDILWYATSKGLTRFDGGAFNAVNETNSPLAATASVHTMALDKDNNKWFYANRSIQLYNDTKGWQIFDSTHIAIHDPYHIITNPRGEVFFTNNKGLLIFKNEKARLIDSTVIWQLPSNNVIYAYFDSRERLWIGTTGGSIMIDNKQKVTVFNNSKTPLDNACISGATEDEYGNLYFSLLANKKPAGDNDEEGIAVMAADGTWHHYNDKNSGMPANHVNSIFYDKFEHVLWICTQQAGLVRFDLKEGWENYNNTNSAMPGFNIHEIAQDSKGIIYAATENGLLRIMKKQ
jgi:ligand-binding sensor domain-containing protein